MRVVRAGAHPTHGPLSILYHFAFQILTEHGKPLDDIGVAAPEIQAHAVSVKSLDQSSREGTESANFMILVVGIRNVIRGRVGHGIPA